MNFFPFNSYCRQGLVNLASCLPCCCSGDSAQKPSEGGLGEKEVKAIVDAALGAASIELDAVNGQLYIKV